LQFGGAPLSLFAEKLWLGAEVDVTDRPDDEVRERRIQPRTEVPARVELRFSSFSKFVSQYVANVSTGGMFIVTQETLPAGTPVEFRLALADGFPLIEGTAQIVWVRDSRQALEGPPGMAVRFLKLDESGRELISRMVEQRRQSGEGVFEVGEATASPVGAGGDPFDVASHAPETPAPVAFDVFPAPAAEEGEFPGVSGAFHVTGVRDEAAEGRAGAGRRTSALIAVIAIVVVSAAALVYLGPWGRKKPVDAPRDNTRSGATARPTQVAIPSTAGGRADATTGENGTAEEAAPAAGAPGAARPADAAGAPGKPVADSRGGTKVGTASPGKEKRARMPEGSGGAQEAIPAAVRGGTAVAGRLSRIDIRREGGGTRVDLLLDGVLARSRIRSFAMDNPPRYVVQVRGLTADNPYAVVGSGTPELQRVRLGYHGEARHPYLQIVLDLSGGDVQVRREAAGSSLILHLARPRR